MAFEKKDKIWLQTEIKKSISEHTDLCAQKRIPQSRWEKFKAWLHKWGALSSIVTVSFFIIAAVLRFWGSYNEYLGRYKEFHDSTIKRLDSTDKDLNDIKWQIRVAQSPASTFKDISELPQNKFSSALLGLKAITEINADEFELDPNLLQTVSNKLISVKEKPSEYWPTVLKFIKFASAGITKNVPPPGPPNSVLSQVYSNYPNGIILPTFKNQVVLLNGGELWNVKFENCRIIFTQEPVKMHNFIFIDCVFEMPITNDPSPYLKQASEKLLASNLKNVSIPSL